ncbi:MAG: glutaredoxin family protein [Peptococcaceae bacterium]|nr:glutaredoxin family protein [Peptococcaceae bacterium]
MVKLYTLSTCPWCKRLKSFLDKEGIEYSFVDIDLLQGKERDRALREVDEISKDRSFPLSVVNGRVIKGFNTDRILAALNDEK